MDEPTSGLDARAAAIVMRTVRNIVNTGRTIVCIIHQPNIEIFESFDELLLMKRGGELIYVGPLGNNSHKLVQFFEAVQGVPHIRPGCNPAAWILDVTSSAEEIRLGIDFAEVYRRLELFQQNKRLVDRLCKLDRDSMDLNFPSKYSQSFFGQISQQQELLSAEEPPQQEAANEVEHVNLVEDEEVKDDGKQEHKCDKKEGKKSSSAWKFFDEIKGCLVGFERAKCKFCKVEIGCISTRNGTSGMMNHLKMVCAKSTLRNNLDKLQKTLQFEKLSKDEKFHNLKVHTFSQERLRI
ncbi:hypothetical protein POM88_045388 [Heracleum sosnowskyi]|uniref:BED-type domain-containing protein n=1 Tax=Heracleum sosnowskyi TaxID=360622 RepID=A0AAD8H775_9APIA|nr:hypothetical protein POM88_045388 [Heracleum sosnowskyi]